MQKESLRSPLAHLDAPLRDTRRAAGVASRHQLGEHSAAQIWGFPGTARPGRHLGILASVSFIR
jgi:hypothetical protein